MKRTAFPFRMSLLAAGVALGTAFSGSATAAVDEYLQRAPKGYVTDSSGNIVTSGTGECVISGEWTTADAVARCHPNLVAQAEPVPAEPEQPAMRQELRRITLDAETTFGFDDANLTEQGRNELDRIAEAVQGARQPSIQITGYTDPIGPEEYNVDLSRRRAEAVRDYLVSRGVPADVIQTAGAGETTDVTCEDLSGQQLIECLRPNRRTEIEFAAFEVVEVPAEGEPMQQPQQQPSDQLQQQDTNPPGTIDQQPGTVQ